MRPRRSHAARRTSSAIERYDPRRAARADRQARHFVDNLTVQVEAGNGGDGCVAFHREKFVAMGPAAGGNGGAGGSVYIRSDATLHSLARVPKQVVAKSGAHGQGAWLHGRRGQDTIISVPVGTTVRSLGQTANMRRQSVQAYYEYLFGSNARRRAGIDLDSEPELAASRAATWRHLPRSEEENYLRSHFRLAEEKLRAELRAQQKIVDALPARERSAASLSRPVAPLTLSELDASQDAGWSIDLSTPTPPDSPGVLLARGGHGGLGNPHFLLDQYRSPKVATRGAPGEAMILALEYKQPSDIGLVGLPNAGKSTLLRCLSRADAEVGAYRFTTLRPNLGVMRLDEHGRLLHTAESDAEASEERLRLTVADLPGLIEDASQNRGLGHDFLRHVERCGFLVYVVDMGPRNPRPSSDVVILNRELDAYRPGLSGRVGLIVANKADLLDAGEEALVDGREKLARLRSDVDMLYGPGRVPVVPISAKHRQNVERLARNLQQVVQARQAPMHDGEIRAPRVA